jgi:hypothetical protein
MVTRAHAPRQVVLQESRAVTLLARADSPALCGAGAKLHFSWTIYGDARPRPAAGAALPDPDRDLRRGHGPPQAPGARPGVGQYPVVTFQYS